MAAILVLTFLVFIAVVGLNLFIALLSDTFQRVYDNAQSIAVLQQVCLSHTHAQFLYKDPLLAGKADFVV